VLGAIPNITATNNPVPKKQNWAEGDNIQTGGVYPTKYSSK
jgi:hypothetical protein